MKMKSFAMLVMSGLLTSSMLYIAPAIADDANDASFDDSMQLLADNSNQGSGQVQYNSGTSPSTTTSTSSTDGGSPDTATGDDDY